VSRGHVRLHRQRRQRGLHLVQDRTPWGSFSTLRSVTAVAERRVRVAAGHLLRESAWAPRSTKCDRRGPSQFYPYPTTRSGFAMLSGPAFSVPDVAGAGDPATGFHIVFGGKDVQVGRYVRFHTALAGTVVADQPGPQEKGCAMGFAPCPLLDWRDPVETGGKALFTTSLLEQPRVLPAPGGLRDGWEAWTRGRSRSVVLIHKGWGRMKRRGPDLTQCPLRPAKYHHTFVRPPPLVTCPHCGNSVPGRDFLRTLRAHLTARRDPPPCFVRTAG